MILAPNLRRWAALFCVGILMPLATILSIWWPIVSKYQTFQIEVSPNLIRELQSTPDDKTLEEIGRQSLAVSPYFESTKDLRNAADKILRGQLVLPRLRTAHLSIPFRIQDLDQDGETLGLQLGSLIDVRILLDAYTQEPREEYLARAVARYAEFAKVESETWLPHGFLWNDHAIAARISLSAELWRLTRNHPKYGPILEKILPHHVWRSIRLLADPAQYTYSTNHGVMQNVALLQANAAFPSIPDSPKLAQLARDRLEAQLGYYLSSEGMILEHSAGYHKHGVELLTIAIRAAELANLPIPDWKPKILKARALLAVMTRPDGSLPRFGNTRGDPEPIHDFIPMDLPTTKDGLTALPLSGYAFWRGSTPTHCGSGTTHLSFVASLFPGHGHKLSDEGSIMLWAGGHVWIDNTGYWPFGITGRTEVDGWRGSNAPHLAEESPKEARVSTLNHAVEENDVLFVESSRLDSNGVTIKRQVIGLNSLAWLIVDSAENPEGHPLTSLWTFSPETNVKVDSRLDHVGYSVSNPSASCSLDMQLFSTAPPTSKLLRGQTAPFGGWMMWHGRPTATTAIELTQTTSPSAVLFSLSSQGFSGATIDHWQGESDSEWQARIYTPAIGHLEINRKPDSISILNNNKYRTIKIEKLESQHIEREKIENSLNNLVKQYPAHRDYIPWRINATKILATVASVFLLPLIILFWRLPKLRRPITYAGTAGWTMVTLWLHFAYFQ